MRGALLLIAATATAAASATAASWPGPPGAAPPDPGTPGAPPPAWFESTSASRWLLYGSYCWTTACVDFIPPDRRPNLPVLPVRRGGTIRFHLRLAPKTAAVQLSVRPVVRPVALRAAQVTSWRPAQSGVFSLQVKSHAGSASYVGRVRVG